MSFFLLVAFFSEWRGEFFLGGADEKGGGKKREKQSLKYIYIKKKKTCPYPHPTSNIPIFHS